MNEFLMPKIQLSKQYHPITLVKKAQSKCMLGLPVCIVTVSVKGMYVYVGLGVCVKKIGKINTKILTLVIAE